MLFLLALLVLTTSSPSLSELKKQQSGEGLQTGSGALVLTLSSMIWGQFKSFRETLLDPVLTL